MSVFKADGVDGRNAPLVKTVTLWATTTVAIGDVVMVDTAVSTYGYGYAVKKTDFANSPLVAGVALQSVTVSGTAYQRVRVQYAGPVGDTAIDPAYLATPLNEAAAAGVITAGSMVGCDTAGRIKVAASPTATLLAFAVCVEPYPATNSSGAGAIMIIDKGWYM